MLFKEDIRKVGEFLKVDVYEDFKMSGLLIVDVVFYYKEVFKVEVLILGVLFWLECDWKWLEIIVVCLEFILFESLFLVSSC